MRLVYTVLTVAILLICHESFAGDIFTITDIEVTGEGETARDAKNDAIATAEKEAYFKLLERITPSFTKHAWPEPEPEKISELIQSFEIKEEKLTSKHYKALLNMSFNPLFVGKLLEESGIVYMKNNDDPIVLLPVLISGKKAILWENSNEWRDTWKESIAHSSFANFVIPKNNISSGNINSILRGEYPLNRQDREIINNLLRTYKAKKVLLAKARYEKSEGGIGLEVEMIYLNDEYPEKNTRLFYGETEKDTLKTVMKEATSDIIIGVEKRWKEAQENTKLSKSKINVTVPIDSLAEWNILSNKLNALDFISRVDTKYVTVEHASLDLHFQNGYQTLIKLLADEGLYLENSRNNLVLHKYDIPPDWYMKEYEEVDYDLQR